MKKVLSILFDCVIAFVVIFAVTITFMSLSSNENGITSINGIMPLNIQSESMNPFIKKGDMIIVKKVNYRDLKVNDVISYLTKKENTTIIVTHRIVEITNNGIITKGDNNDIEDDDKVYESNLVGKYDDVRVPVLGNVLTFLQSQVGFFIFIIIPLFILFIYQLYKFISIIMDEKKKEMLEQIRQEQAKQQ